MVSLNWSSEDRKFETGTNLVIHRKSIIQKERVQDWQEFETMRYREGETEVVKAKERESMSEKRQEI